MCIYIHIFIHTHTHVFKNIYLYLCIFEQPWSAWSMFSVSLPAFCTFPFALSLLRSVDERKLVDLLQSMAAKVKVLY